MRTLVKKNKSVRKLSAGFTLAEMLVSIAIFAIMSVLMSNIVLDIAKFSIDSERRTDLLTELDSTANVVKNDMRGAKAIGICTNMEKVYRTSTEYSPNKSFVLTTSQNALQWEEVVLSATTPITCTLVSGSTPIVINSPSSGGYSGSFTIKNFDISMSTDGNTANLNTLFYFHLQVCDPDDGRKTYVFDCNRNLYNYVFGVSTRNIS